MKDWYNGLQSRERYLVIAGSLVMILVLLYALVWDPVFQKAKRLEKSVAANKQTVAWMQSASAEVRGLRRSGVKTVDTDTSLISAVEASAKKSGLRDSVARMEPLGANKINVELRDANFDRLMIWVGMLSQEYAANVSQFTSDAADDLGRVNARMTLTREAS